MKDNNVNLKEKINYTARFGGDKNDSYIYQGMKTDFVSKKCNITLETGEFSPGSHYFTFLGKINQKRDNIRPT